MVTNMKFIVLLTVFDIHYPSGKGKGKKKRKKKKSLLHGVFAFGHPAK